MPQNLSLKPLKQPLKNEKDPTASSFLTRLFPT